MKLSIISSLVAEPLETAAAQPNYYPQIEATQTNLIERALV